MTKLSRWKVEEEKMNLFLDDLWAACTSLESKREAKRFFSQFLTHTERKMFAKRLQVIMMLLLGYDYAAIKKRVRVTDSTIAKMANWLEEGRETIVKVAKRILSLKKEKSEKMARGGKKHLPGDLLSPLVGGVADTAIRQLCKKKKRSSLSR